jgi:alanyl-tRNA synthetase
VRVEEKKSYDAYIKPYFPAIKEAINKQNLHLPFDRKDYKPENYVHFDEVVKKVTKERAGTLQGSCLNKLLENHGYVPYFTSKTVSDAAKEVLRKNRKYFVERENERNEFMKKQQKQTKQEKEEGEEGEEEDTFANSGFVTSAKQCKQPKLEMWDGTI